MTRIRRSFAVYSALIPILVFSKLKMKKSKRKINKILLWVEEVRLVREILPNNIILIKNLQKLRFLISPWGVDYFQLLRVLRRNFSTTKNSSAAPVSTPPSVTKRTSKTIQKHGIPSLYNDCIDLTPRIFGSHIPGN